MITTVSSTPCWKNGPAKGFAAARARRVVAWLAGFVLLLAGGFAQASDISALRVDRSPEGWSVSAQVQFELPAVVDEALQKGIPMFFVVEAVVQRDRWYWYDKEVARAARTMRLSYQPLTRRWRLLLSSAAPGSAAGTAAGAGLALGQNFDTRDEALAAVRRISGWKIAEPQELDDPARHTITLRFRLDTSQLPRPFQIGVVGQDEWNISAALSQRLSAEAAR